MESSIQLTPKNTPQDCRRAQSIPFFYGKQQEEGGTEVVSATSAAQRGLGALQGLECGNLYA